MNQEQSIALFLEGKEAWNKWANERLAEKEELEKAGKWKEKEGFDDQDRSRAMSADASIPEIQNWLDKAFVDFSNLTFQTEQSSEKQIGSCNKSISCKGNSIDFSHYIFPSLAVFSSSAFQGRAVFSSSVFYDLTYFDDTSFEDTVEFSEAVFVNDVYYFKSVFKKDAFFNKTKFEGNSSFVAAVFKNRAYFTSAVFKKNVYFSAAAFKAPVYFWSATFVGHTDFNSTAFNGDAFFKSTEFKSEVVFKDVAFKKSIEFVSSIFNKQANFEAIEVKRAFNLANAKFTSEVPIFTQANFAESPRLDNVEVLPSPQYQSSAINITGPLRWQRFLWKQKFLPYLLRTLLRTILNLVLLPFSLIHHAFRLVKFKLLKFINHRKNPDEEAHYRALKRLAIQAHDHVNEMKFFAGEIRARRHVSDKLLSPVGFIRYLVGVAYELTSNFGRSFILPLFWWCVAFILFSCAYISGTGLDRTAKCTNSNNLSVSQAAYTIGLKNSLLIMGLSKTDTVKQAQACLYGANALAKKGDEAAGKQQNPRLKTNYQGLSKSHNPATAEIPFWKTVYGIIHSILSLTFIFLFLLALRNQFKIK